MAHINHFLCHIIILLFSKYAESNLIQEFNCKPAVREIVNYRLPDTYLPIHYNLLIQPFLERNNMTFRGRTTMYFIVKVATNMIFLNSKLLTINSIELNRLVPREKLEILRYEQYCDREAIGIYLREPLEMNVFYYLTVRYFGKIGKRKIGLHLSYFKNANKIRRRGLMNSFEPTNARLAFPCFDEPNKKTTFNVTIVHPKRLVALSNMPALHTANTGRHWKQTIFKITPPMTTYMVSLYLGNLKTKKSGIVTAYAQADYIDSLKFSMTVTPKILSKYEKIFNSTFPVPKLNFIITERFGGLPSGYWGIIKFDRDSQIFDPRIHPFSMKSYIVSIISYAISLQWFVNWASPCWWDDLFISKGLAVIFQFGGLKMAYPKENMDTYFVSNMLFNMLRKEDINKKRLTMISNIKTPKDIKMAFNDFTYGKAAAIIRMIAYHLGIGNFMKGLKIYLHNNGELCTTSTLFYHTLYKVAKAKGFKFEKYYYEKWKGRFSRKDKFENPINTLAQSWTMLAGYPILLVYRNYENGSISLFQAHSITGRMGMFHIPITYTTANELNWKPVTRFMMTSRSHVITIKDLKNTDWVIFNIQHAGFYRVDYDITNWDMLSEDLWKNHRSFPPIMRAQLLHDLWSLVMEDPQFLNNFLGACQYLYYENDPVAIIVYIDIFRSLYVMTKNSPDLTQSLFDYTNLILGNIYKTFPWTTFKPYKDKAGESKVFLKNRVLYLMCLIGNADCRTTARNHFIKWKRKPNEYYIPVEFKYLVFLYGLQRGKHEDRVFLEKCLKDINYKNDWAVMKLSLESEIELMNIFEAQDIKDKDIKINRFFYRSTHNPQMYNSYMVYDLDHRNAENTYFESILKAHVGLEDEYEMDLNDYFEEWYQSKNLFYLQMSNYRKYHKSVPYKDKGYSLLNKMFS